MRRIRVALQRDTSFLAVGDPLTGYHFCPFVYFPVRLLNHQGVDKVDPRPCLFGDETSPLNLWLLEALDFFW
jgi:hypothetical protein